MSIVNGNGPRKVRARRSCRGGRRNRFLVEILEGRQLLATIVVNTAAEFGDPAAGTISLFDAVELSNGQVPISSLSAAQAHQVVGGLTVPNLIDFDIPGTGPFLIKAGLQPIERPVIIDGYSQPGARPNTNGLGLPDNAVIQIELDGQGDTGIDLEVGDCTVQGLAIGDCIDGIDLAANLDSDVIPPYPAPT